MAYTIDQVRSEASKFLQRAPSISKTSLGGKNEETSFLRLQETILMTIGLRPEVLHYLRYLGRNRLLQRARSVASRIADLIIHAEASTRQSLRVDVGDHLSKARKKLEHADLSSSVTGSASSVGLSLDGYRSAISKAARALRTNSLELRGAEARRELGRELPLFFPEYRTFVTDLYSFTFGFDRYDRNEVKKRVTPVVMARVLDSVRLAEDFFDGAAEQTKKETSSAYLLNLASGSGSLEAVASFRDPLQPLVRSVNLNNQERDGIPHGTAFLGNALSATPATVSATKAPYIFPAGATLSLGVDGGAAVSVPMPAAATTSQAVAALINAAVPGLTATVTTTLLGSVSSDGYPLLGTGQFTAANSFTVAAGTAASVQEGDTLFVKSGPSMGRYTVVSVVGDVITTAEAATVGLPAAGYYAQSDRLTLSSSSTGTNTAVEVATATGNTHLGLVAGVHTGQTLTFEVSGTDNISPSSGRTDTTRYGVSEGAYVVVKNQRQEYEMVVTATGSDGVLELAAVSGQAALPSNLANAQVEIHSPMARRSKSLTQECKGYIDRRRGRPMFTPRDVVRLYEAMVTATNNPGQLRAKLATPLSHLADMLVSLVDTVPRQAEVTAALQRQGVTMPSPSGATLEARLLSYEDVSAAGDKERAVAILQSLEERGYDRGRDLLLRGDLVGFLSMTNRDASYGAAVLEGMKTTASGFPSRP